MAKERYTITTRVEFEKALMRGDDIDELLAQCSRTFLIDLLKSLDAVWHRCGKMTMKNEFLRTNIRRRLQYDSGRI